MLNVGQTESTLFHSAGLRHLGLWILWLSVSNVCSRAHWHTDCWLEAAAQDPKWQLSVLLTDTEINIWVMCWRLQEREQVYSLLTCRGVEQLLNILRFKTNFLNIFGVFGFMFKFYFPQASRAPHTSSYRIVKLKLQVYSPSSSSSRGRIILQMYETTRGVLDLLFEPRKHPQTASVSCMWGEMVQKLLITSRV